MPKPNFRETVETILQTDSRYAIEAYTFMRESVDYTVKSLKRSSSSPRHVSGQELLDGIRQHALEEYGPMAHSVLQYWGITTCADFGAIVFNLINHGLLTKTDADSPDDFLNGYTFEDAFIKPFMPRTEHTARTTKKSRPVKRSVTPPSKKADTP